MVKKSLSILFSVASALLITLQANAADVYQTINVTGFSGNYSRVDFSPRATHVKQGDTLHLTINNNRITDTRFFMPTFNIDQVIPKTGIAKIDICIANPVSELSWFSISAVDGDRVPGYLVTENFRVPTVSAAANIVDASVVNSAINYSKDYCYPSKSEPKYKTSKKTDNKVRGYW